LTTFAPKEVAQDDGGRCLRADWLGHLDIVDPV